MATDSNRTPDFQKLSGEMYHQWEKVMTAWWDQVLESPAFLDGVNQGMTGASQARGHYQKAVTQWMEQAHLPTRDDVVRLLRVSTLLEDKLLAQEDLLLRLEDRLAQAERESIEARIAAAEAQLAVHGALTRIEAKLDGLVAPASAAASAPAAEAAPRRGRKETP